MLETRMEMGLFTVVDAMHLHTRDFKKYKELADLYGYKIYVKRFANVTLEELLARNKDNKHIEGFKGSSNQFIVTDVSNVSEKFEEFVSKQLGGTLCRCYVSVNKRNGSLVQKHLISYLALNDADLSKISRKTTSIAMLPQCAVTKKWLFDFDYESEEQVLEFVQDIKNIDNTLEVEYKKTVHGYAVTTNHSFDTRELLKKWVECENKKDGMLLLDRKVK